VEYETEVHDPYIFAFDPHTGEELAAVRLPSNATGAPMTCLVDGKQIIILPVGGA
jgi:quinoprotein glucose dehydrogenase